MEKDYEEHIKNKALLSYDSRKRAEDLAEYLAGEIIEMRRLEWLKGKLEGVLAKLTEEEKILVEGRYFGKRKRLKQYLHEKREDENGRGTSERNYFRRQRRLGEKLEKMLTSVGVTEEAYFSQLHSVEIFAKIYKMVERETDGHISLREGRLVKG